MFRKRIGFLVFGPSIFAPEVHPVFEFDKCVPALHQQGTLSFQRGVPFSTKMV